MSRTRRYRIFTTARVPCCGPKNKSGIQSAKTKPKSRVSDWRTKSISDIISNFSSFGRACGIRVNGRGILFDVGFSSCLPFVENLVILPTLRLLQESDEQGC